MILRVKFKKYGPVRFIGHLDVMRFFQKAIRRADIDVAYSSGYSPHQIMSFASPLSVGLESNGEYMDVQVNSLPNNSCEEFVRCFNEASVPGIEVLSVKVLPENAGNAMASVAAASYTVRFREGREPECFGKLTDNDIQKTLETFLTQEEILYTKETKKGTREIDLRAGIYEFTYNPDNNSYFLLVDASSAGNIKPSQIFDALLSSLGEPMHTENSHLFENALLITREDTFMDIGEEEKRNLVPLDYIGQ